MRSHFHDTSRDPATEVGAPVLAGPGTVTAIAGLTFAISDELGDIGSGPAGLILHDTRHLSRLQLRIEGERPKQLGAAIISADTVRFRGYWIIRDHHLDAPLEVERSRRVVPDGMNEEIVLQWWPPEPADLTVSLAVDCDFADIFEVRRAWTGLGEPPIAVVARREPGQVEFETAESDRATSVRFSHPADRADAEGSHWSVRLRHGFPWRLGIEVRGTTSAAGGRAVIEIGHPPPPRRAPAVVRSDPPDLERACRQSLADFDSLSLPDNLAPTRRLLAAGIPWFVALFGRDSLIASHQSRAFDPDRMIDTLAALAARQGRVNDPANQEEPGKILHEVRFTDRPWLGEGTTGGARPYFGSIDATPLFLIVYGTVWRWGAPREVLQEFLPAARAALGWMRRHGDPDGDGLLEYRPTGPGTLRNQGWKDSDNAVQFPDGRLASGAIALAEVQGYAYRARRELAAVLEWLGEDEEAADLHAEADLLRTLIRERYWCPGEPGFFALALDGDKARIDSIASNMGHLLWCGVPSNEEADQVAAHLVGPSMANGWGLRTISNEMRGFNPIAYHAGSVWPHDTVIACEGLRRYGLDEAALGLAADLTDALVLFGNRLPELFGGFTREGHDFPVPYPASCRPQAWAAGVPLALVALYLGLEPCVPKGSLSLNPVLPRGLQRMQVRDIPFPSGRLSVEIGEDGARVIEAPPDLAVELRAREIPQR